MSCRALRFFSFLLFTFFSSILFGSSLYLSLLLDMRYSSIYETLQFSDVVEFSLTHTQTLSLSIYLLFLRYWVCMNSLNTYASAKIETNVWKIYMYRKRDRFETKEKLTHSTKKNQTTHIERVQTPAQSTQNRFILRCNPTITVWALVRWFVCLRVCA